MPESASTILERRLDAWGRAELHTASKGLPAPGPAFINAVAAEARHRTMLLSVGLAVLLLALLTVIGLAYLRANPPGSSDSENIRSAPEVRSLSPSSPIR